MGAYESAIKGTLLFGMVTMIVFGTRSLVINPILLYAFVIAFKQILTCGFGLTLLLGTGEWISATQCVERKLDTVAPPHPKGIRS